MKFESDLPAGIPLTALTSVTTTAAPTPTTAVIVATATPTFAEVIATSLVATTTTALATTATTATATISTRTAAARCPGFGGIHPQAPTSEVTAVHRLGGFRHLG